MTAAALKERIAAALAAVRDRSLALTSPLDDADLTRQHSPLMSPLVWDLAHVGSYEELWLLRAVAGVAPLRPEIDDLYDAFAHPRRDRPALPILGPHEARGYIAGVRSQVLDVLHRTPLTAEPDRPRPLTDRGFIYGTVVSHEQQHGETMLATLALAGPSGAVVRDLSAPTPQADPAAVAALPPDVAVPAGPFTMGTSSEPWAWDNEQPAHRVDVPAFRIDTVPVTNAAYAAFVAAGGYDDPRLWTELGWAHRVADGLTAPLGWRPDGAGGWLRMRFGVAEAVPGDEPVQHVSCYEAAAFARWAGRRLPTEAEWEKACVWDPATSTSRRWPWGDADPTPALANLGGRHAGPAPVGTYPAGASPCGAQQMTGDVWEWCASDFRPYPGFRAYPYPEYSEVFFGADYRILRGGSWASQAESCRPTFRNWDLPVRRQIFAGFRTAVSV